MATESSFVWDETLGTASADLSAKQFYAVKLDSTGVAVSAAADPSVGILQNKPKSGEAANVRVLGISKGYSDGSGTAIARGDLVGPSSTGTLVKKATADYNVLGIAMDASSAAGTIIRVLMIAPGGFPFRSLLG